MLAAMIATLFLVKYLAIMKKRTIEQFTNHNGYGHKSCTDRDEYQEIILDYVKKHLKNSIITNIEKIKIKK